MSSALFVLSMLLLFLQINPIRLESPSGEHERIRLLACRRPGARHLLVQPWIIVKSVTLSVHHMVLVEIYGVKGRGARRAPLGMGLLGHFGGGFGLRICVWLIQQAILFEDFGESWELLRSCGVILGEVEFHVLVNDL